MSVKPDNKSFKALKAFLYSYHEKNGKQPTQAHAALKLKLSLSTIRKYWGQVLASMEEEIHIDEQTESEIFRAELWKLVTKGDVQGLKLWSELYGKGDSVEKRIPIVFLKEQTYINPETETKRRPLFNKYDVLLLDGTVGTDSDLKKIQSLAKFQTEESILNIFNLSCATFIPQPHLAENQKAFKEDLQEIKKNILPGMVLEIDPILVKRTCPEPETVEYMRDLIQSVMNNE